MRNYCRKSVFGAIANCINSRLSILSIQKLKCSTLGLAMFVQNCCGFIELRLGLIILSVVELLASAGQFGYATYKGAGTATTDVVITCSISEIIGSGVLLFGVLQKHQNVLVGHMGVRTLGMTLSIISSIMMFTSVDVEKNSSLKIELLVGIYFLGKFLLGFYFLICIHSFCKTIGYYYFS